MHRLTSVTPVLTALALLTACAGDPAAPGPDAGDGPDGGDAPGGVTELARGNFSVLSIAVDATHAYFSGRAPAGVSVYRVPLAGGALETVCAATNDEITGITLTAADVYFVADGKYVAHAPKAGGARVQVGPDQVIGPAIRSDGATVTYSSAFPQANAGTWKLAAGNDVPVRLLQNVLQFQLLDGGFGYFTPSTGGGGPVVRIDLATGVASNFVVDTAGPRRVAVNADHVFWFGQTVSQGTGAISSSPKAAPAVTLLAPGPQPIPPAMVADATHLRWISPDVDANNVTITRVWRLPVGGGTPESTHEVAEGALALAQSSDAIFTLGWVYPGGEQETVLLKIAK